MIDKARIIDTINSKFKGQAINDTGSCKYQTEDGKNCAIGLFIPKDHPALKFSGTVSTLLLTHPDLKDHMPSDDVKFLTRFQQYHDHYLDNGKSLEGQKQQLIKFVNNY